QASRPVLPPDVLVDLDRPEAVLIVPDADSRAQVRMLVNSLRGYRAAVGPSVPPGAAGNSMRWARRALDLARRGVLASEELVWCQRHLAVLTLFQDEALLESFVECRLRPLRRLRESQRGVLGGTMLAWLQHGMNATAVATALHVHVQTVRRRLRQLDQLFGEQIEDPVLRFELQLALWADRVRRGGQPGHGPDTGHYTGD
ncbi:MAG TPA: helix-turn-helix domain-containing protein, partial [Rugosimonospora sp.]|nr:helix-turn-helix domain-containing protein [Rugosimonospora sp.]